MVSILETQIIYVGILFFFISCMFLFEKFAFKIIWFFLAYFYAFYLATLQYIWVGGTREELVNIADQILVLFQYSLYIMIFLFTVYGAWWTLSNFQRLKVPFAKRKFDNEFNPFKEKKEREDKDDE